MATVAEVLLAAGAMLAVCLVVSAMLENRRVSGPILFGVSLGLMSLGILVAEALHAVA